MSKERLQLTLDAITGLSIAMTKLAQVVHDNLIDPAIHTTNSPDLTPPIAETAQQPPVNTPPTATTDTVTGELDGEGRPWIKDIHTKKPSLMNSPDNKGVQKWKFARGLSQEAKDKYHADYPLNLGTANTPAATNTPPANTPALPGQPPAGNTPPVAADPNESVRKEILAALQKLSAIGVTWDDLKEMFNEKFDSVQNSEQITLANIPTARYAEVATFCDSIVNMHTTLGNIVAELYAIATPQHKGMIDEGLTAFYAEYNTDQLSGVYYDDLESLKVKLDGMLESWKKWAAGG